MTQILITGMHRSGTTLCFDLLRRHPEIVHGVNEGVVFDRETSRLMEPPYYSSEIDDAQRRPGARPGERHPVQFDGDPREVCWVAKMSYPGPVILQQWCAPTDKYIIAWLDAFGADARVIHVIRHPFAVFVSAKTRWGADPVHLNNYGPVTLESVCRDWAISNTAVNNVLKGDKRALTVLYEDLVTEPDVNLTGIFEHCNLASEKERVHNILGEKIAFFGKVDSSRAQAHRATPLEPISRATSWLLTPLFDKWGYADR